MAKVLTSAWQRPMPMTHGLVPANPDFEPALESALEPALEPVRHLSTLLLTNFEVHNAAGDRVQPEPVSWGVNHILHLQPRVAPHEKRREALSGGALHVCAGACQTSTMFC